MPQIAAGCLCGAVKYKCRKCHKRHPAQPGAACPDNVAGFAQNPPAA